MMYSYIAGEITKSQTSCDFVQLIKAIQVLNKNNSSINNKETQLYASDISSLHKALESGLHSWIALYQKDLGYSLSQATEDLQHSLLYLKNFPEPTIFDPKHARPMGLIAVHGTWSSPLYRFIHLVLPALVHNNSVLLYCDPEVSEIYCRLSKLLENTTFGENRLIVLPITEADILDALLEHPSINAHAGHMHLYESAPYRTRSLVAEKLYSLHFGAHNPVLIMNDAPLEILETPLRQSLQCHTRSELRFNRWFVQEKIYPQFLEFASDFLQKARLEDWGQIKNSNYQTAIQAQHTTLAATKHWLFDKSQQGINMCADFSNCSPLHQTELLGANITITRFKNGPEATKFAGTTHFANATSIFTANTEKYLELAKQQLTPLVYHNTLPSYFDISLLSGNRQCALKTTESVFSEKRIILF